MKLSNSGGGEVVVRERLELEPEVGVEAVQRLSRWGVCRPTGCHDRAWERRPSAQITDCRESPVIRKMKIVNE
jgi:hypothetical protein